MSRPKTIAIILLVLTLAASLFIGYDREGFLSWIGVLLSVVILALSTRLTEKQTLASACFVVGVLVVAWVGAVYYVFNGWESGEVVEVRLNDETHFRTWVVDLDGQEALLYVCPPDRQSVLEMATNATYLRGGEQFQVGIRAEAVALDAEVLSRIYALYLEKHPEQDSATTVYYLLIGPKRGSQNYIVYIDRSESL